MSITAMVENNAIHLPVHVPDGTRVEVVLPEGLEATPTLFERLERFVGCIKEGPADLAAEHDHYAHGTPRRGE